MATVSPLNFSSLTFVLLGNLVLFGLSTAPSRADLPPIDAELWVGRSIDAMIAALGPPTYPGSGVDGSRDVNYVWMHSVVVDGKVKFDGRGFPPDGVITEQDTTTSCRVTFQVHRSGLVLHQTSLGSCQPPEFVEGTSEARDRMRLVSSSVAVRYDGPDAAQRVVAPLGYYFVLEDYQAFDHYLDVLRVAETLQNGRPQLALAPDSLTELFASHRKWDVYRKRLETWRGAHPESIGAALTLATYWNAYAWEARGHGYANSVSAEGAALFRDRMNKALLALENAPTTARHNPVWYQMKLRYQAFAGASQADMSTTLAAGIAAFPDYWPLQTERVSTLDPRMGGSIEAIDTFIAQQVANVDRDEQLALYARLYWATQQSLGSPTSIFQHTRADWTVMASGFRALLKRFPMSFWNRQNFAVFACRAGDAATYRELRPSIEGFIHPAAWEAPLTLDTCDYRLLTGS